MIKTCFPQRRPDSPRSRLKSSGTGALQVDMLEMRGAATAPLKRSKPVNGIRRSIAAPLAHLRSASSHTSPLFAGFSELVSASFSFSAGGEIFGEGEEASFVYKLVKGAVRVGKTLSDGQRHISSFHLPGEVFGFERTATHRMGAEAIEDSQVLMFRRPQVERLIARELSASHQMLGIFADKLEDAEIHMFRLGRQSALQRVAAFLLEMEGRLGRRGLFELPMSRRDIGDYLGLSIETVSRAISQLHGRNALDRREPRRLLLDQNKMDAMVEH